MTIQLGDVVSGFYFGEHAFEGTLTAVDSGYFHVRLAAPCHRYQAGESIAFRRDDIRIRMRFVSRPDGVRMGFDSTTGARYAI